MERKDKLVEKVYNMCTVYPLPEREEVIDEIRKVELIMECRSEEQPSIDSVAESISETLDIRKRLNSDDWIEYKKSQKD